MITEDQATRLLKRADPARVEDSVPMLDVSDYLDVLHARRTTVTLIDSQPTHTEGNGGRRRPFLVVVAASAAAIMATTAVLVSRDDSNAPANTPGADVDLPATTAATTDSPTSTTAAPTGQSEAAMVAIAERFMEARNAGDIDTALSLLDDRVNAQLMADNRMNGNLWSVPLEEDEVVLALEAEQLYDVRYEPFACDSARIGYVRCTYSMDSRLRRIEGLAPIESYFDLSVFDGVVRTTSFPWLSIGADPGGYWPVELGNFMRWLDAVHPDAHPPYTWPPEPAASFGPSQLFYWEGQELIHILTRDTVDLLAGYLDEYEQFRATGADVSVSEIAADFVGDRPGGVSVLVTRNGVTTTGAAGAANANGDPITAVTPFRVGGLIKPFIATMVLQLADEQRVDLDAPLSTYTPETPVGGDVTLRALLSHEGGLPDYMLSPEWKAASRADPARWFTADELLAYVEAMGPNGPDQGGYSNTNYVLLAKLVERLDGATLATALANRITGPLGMTATRLESADEPSGDDLAGGWSSGELDGIPLNGDPATPYNSIISSYALVSTTGDLATFLTALFAGELLSPEALDEMTTIRESGNSLGLFDISAATGFTGLGSNHFIGGYVAVMGIDPQTRDVLVVLTNNDELIPETLAWLLALR